MERSSPGSGLPEPSIDVVFPVLGKDIPLDHSYPLYSALSTRLPGLHDAGELGVFALQGRQGLKDTLDVRRGSLRLRCPASLFGKLLRLAGAELTVAGARLRLGVPTARPLEPAPSLAARLVTIKGFTEEAPFLQAAERQLSALGTAGTLKLGRRRIVTIAGKRVVGFELVASGLSDEHSLLLQERGLGGRRHMGCGLFLPLPRRGQGR